MKSASRPILGALRARSYAAQAAAAEAESSVNVQKPQVTQLKSGAVVASVQNNSPIVRLAFFVKAGPRYETGAFLGASHALRNYANLSNENISALSLTRTIQQTGGSLTCSSSREHMIYTLNCLRNQVEVGFDLLSDIVSAPVLKRWEVDEAVDRLSLDLAIVKEQPQVQLLEGLHQAAFRNTLGRSLYSPANRVGTHSSDLLTQYLQNNYTAGNLAVVGFGVNHENLLKKIDVISDRMPGAATQPEASKYHGGEFRLDTNSPLTHAAIVTQGVPLGSNDLLAVGVLQRVMGTGPYVKYGSNLSSSKVSKAAAAGTKGSYAANCISASYSDNGLFGFQVVAPSNDIGDVLKSLVATFSEATKGGITEEDVQRAKNQLRAAIAMEMESEVALLEDIGVQCATAGNIISLATIDKNIERLNLSSIQNVAKKVINNGKPTMAVVGDLSKTPFLDELL